jgi:hypothetical protein
MDLLGASPFLNPGQLAGLVAAALLGAAIGLERQLRGIPRACTPTPWSRWGPRPS